MPKEAKTVHLKMDLVCLCAIVKFFCGLARKYTLMMSESRQPPSIFHTLLITIMLRKKKHKEKKMKHCNVVEKKFVF